ALAVLLGRLGAVEATKDKVDTAPAPRPEGISDYDPGLWEVPPPPVPPPPAGAPVWEAKWIEIDISAQYMQAWQYDVVVNGAYVSTGVAGYETPTGTFWIFSKLRYDDMTSGLAVPPGEYYYVEDVPHVMYFAAGGYAIHGAYWHNMFGTPFSHGCVSTPLWQAEWFYNWAPYNTRVWIHW
ncbi:MAG: L,D-transpeptidase, partial [Thermomicrobiales bacterium]